jgi:peptidoglycan/LPS O-acetylase OafA/YrhL
MSTSQKPEDTPKSKYQCPAGCPHCSGAAEQARHCAEDGPSGWRLSVSAAMMFLFPLILAMVTAMVLGPDRLHQLLGALLAGVIGVVAAQWVIRWTLRPAKESP